MLKVSDDVRRILDSYDYMDGGAFAEVPVAQFPGGIGRDVIACFPTSDSKEISPLGTAVALVLPSGPPGTSAEVALRNVEETKQALENRRQQQLCIRAANDPNALVAKRKNNPPPALTVANVEDPAPIVRSPTKKKDAEDVGFVPFAVNEWKNGKNMIIPVEQRLAARAENPTPILAQEHIDMTKALREAQREHRMRDDERKKAIAAELQQQQAAEEEEMAKRAKAHLQARLQHDEGKSDPERRALEREQREREREHERQNRRLERLANRLGMSVENLRDDPELLRLAETQRIGNSQHSDSRLENAAAAAVAEDTYTQSTVPVGDLGRVRNAGILHEMEELARREQAGIRPSEIPALPASEGDDDDDIFDVGSVIASRKRLRSD